MKRNWALMVGLALGLAVVGLTGCSPGSTVLEGVEGININSQQSGIWVNGQGKVTAVPDIATLRLGIEAEAASVAEAQSRAAEAMDSVVTALTRNGVAKKDIQTQQFSIRRITKWDRVKEEETVTGYRVTNMVAAKIRGIDEAGTIIDAVAEAGGDLPRIDNISFSVDDPSAYYEEARREAMTEAKAKAKQLAELAGVTLGKPTYISESMQIPYPRAMMMEEAVALKSAAPTPISPGEVEINLSLQVVYVIR